MISKEQIAEERKNIPWKEGYMVEQDLIISRALITLYQNPIIRDGLVFRGGTALNKLFLNPPARFSEDLDFVQLKPEPIGKTIDAIRETMKWFLEEADLKRPKVKLGPGGTKILFSFLNVEGELGHLKIEINTQEHFHVENVRAVGFACASRYFSGQASVFTYSLEELMATKLRALYQRRKGRDLFDMWHVFSKRVSRYGEEHSHFS